jgi:CMP-N,N'-diacetyllegionaminic acid synthase
MINGKRVIAIVPARAGSKGLPGKNLMDMCGKPLIAWSISQGLACSYVDKVLVSTDSEEIAVVAKVHGASVPFLRPAELAGDEASSVDVLLHAIDYLSSIGETYDYLVLLEPTSPLRDVFDIAGALELMDRTSAFESVVGVAKVESSHPAFLFIERGGFMEPMLGSQPTGLRRQDIKEDFYFLEGSIYASTIACLQKTRSFYHSATTPWIVDRFKAIEIDELCDFIMAEALMQAKLDGVLI